MRLSTLLYRTKRTTVNAICFLFDMALTAFKSRTDVNSQLLKTVLVIRLDAIGDFIIWTDSAKAYRQLYPPGKYRLILLGNQAWQSLAVEMQLFDEVWAIDRKKFIFNLLYRFKTLKYLSQYALESVIYPAYSREFSTGDLLVKWLNASQKIGIMSDDAIDSKFWTGLSHSWYTTIYSIPVKNPHELYKNAAFIRALGSSDFRPRLPSIPIGFSKDNDNIKMGEVFYILFPGARIPLRQWDPLSYAHIAERIYKQTGWKGLICGAMSEKPLALQIIAATNIPLADMTGETTLKQLISLIAAAKFLIGNETSGVHIAVAVDTPSVCILGGGHFGRFVPYPGDIGGHLPNSEINASLQRIASYPMPCFNCDWNCIYKASKNSVVPCIEKISIQSVWNEIDELLKII